MDLSLPLWRVREMSSDTTEITEEKINITCPSCNKELSFPTSYRGRIKCPVCAETIHILDPNELSDGVNLDDLEARIDQRFWLGFFIPMLIPIVMSMILFSGIRSTSSPDIGGLIYVMCSLLLWPIVAIVLAVSSNTFVKSFRKGAGISTIIGVVITIVIWIWLFSFLSGGITN